MEQAQEPEPGPAASSEEHEGGRMAATISMAVEPRGLVAYRGRDATQWTTTAKATAERPDTSRR